MRSPLRHPTLASVLSFLMVSFCQAQDVPMRTWSDLSGKFSVRAKLHDQNESQVTLHTEDGRSIQVPIQRLSQADQDYLASVRAPADDPFAGGKPLGASSGGTPLGASSGGATMGTRSQPAAAPSGTLDAMNESASVGESMALPAVGNTVDLAAEDSLETMLADPLPKPPSLPEAVALITTVDAYDKVSAPILADAGASRFVVSVGRNKSGAPQETRGRLFVVELQGNRATQVWDKPSAVRVLDHHQPSGRTLIVDQLDQFQRAGELVMLEGVLEGSPKVLYRRSLPGLGKPGFQPMVEWARLLSGSHVAAIVDGALLVWDLPASQLLYRIEGVKASEPPAFSGQLRYMAIPQGGKVVLVETATGRVGKTLSTGSSLAPGVAFHPNGKLLAVCSSNQYLVWDCLEDKIVSEAVTTDHLGTSPLEWVGNKMFRTALGSVIDVELGMPVWKYHVGAASAPIIVGNRLLTVTTLPAATLCSLPVPHPNAEQGFARLMRAGDDAMLVRPGSQVAIEVEGVGGSDAAEIQQALTTAAEKAGWKTSKRAPIRLVAKIGRGEQEELHYRSLGGDSRKTSTATLTPFTADLEIRSGANVLWERSSTNHVPHLLRLEEGETVQDAVKRYEKPDPGFFSRLNLPPRIPKPELADQIGMSSLKDGKWMEISAEIRNRSRRSR